MKHADLLEIKLAVVKHVRDVSYWRLPAGTPIVAHPDAKALSDAPIGSRFYTGSPDQPDYHWTKTGPDQWHAGTLGGYSTTSTAALLDYQRNSKNKTALVKSSASFGSAKAGKYAGPTPKYAGDPKREARMHWPSHQAYQAGDLVTPNANAGFSREQRLALYNGKVVGHPGPNHVQVQSDWGNGKTHTVVPIDKIHTMEVRPGSGKVWRQPTSGELDRWNKANPVKEGVVKKTGKEPWEPGFGNPTVRSLGRGAPMGRTPVEQVARRMAAKKATPRKAAAPKHGITIHRDEDTGALEVFDKPNAKGFANYLGRVDTGGWMDNPTHYFIPDRGSPQVIPPSVANTHDLKKVADWIASQRKKKS